MTNYISGYNMPGYMPDNEPADFDSLKDAWNCLKEDLKRYMDECLDCSEFELTDTYNDMVLTLEELGEASPQECNVHFGDYVYWITKP